MLNNPFTVFKHTVNVLVVDDMPEILAMVEGLLDIFGIYAVHTAESTREALEIIAQCEDRFHACLFDLGMNDVESNEFHLLDKFGKTIPFIIMTATDDTEKAFECNKRGAKAFIKKATPSFNRKLVSSLDKFALLNMICPGYAEGDEGLLCRCVEALVETNPLQVNDWAREVDVLESKLRKEWKKQLVINPKHALCVFHVFSEAFNLVENACINNDTLFSFNTKECGKSLLNSIAYKRCLEYYILNRQEIAPLIYGHQKPSLTH